MNKHHLMLVCLLSLSIAAFGGTINVPGDQPGIVDALSAANAGDIIVLADDTYYLTDQLTIDKGVTLKGSSAEKCILKQTAKQKRVIKLDNADARVENLTVTGGNNSSDNWTTGIGIAITANGGTVSHCIISNNILSSGYQKGGGVYMEAGRLEFCKILNNQAGVRNASYGGGVACMNTTSKAKMPVVDTCLIAGNNAQAAAGGVYVASYAKFLNTTIVNNSTSGETGGGGIYIATENFWMENCIIAGNSATHASAINTQEWGSSSSASKFTSKVGHCLYQTGSVLGNSGTCFTGNPLFKAAAKGNYHLSSKSPARNVADAEQSLSTDLDDVPRGDAPDLGCYEYDASRLSFSCELSFSPTALLKSQPTTLSATIVNPPDDIDPVYTWTFTRAEDSFVTNVVRYTDTETVALGLVGTWTVTLVVSDNNSGEDSEPTTSGETLLTGAPHYYVTTQPNEDSSFPYETEKSAATALSQVAPYLVDGSIVHLEDGIHQITSQIKISRGAILRGSSATNCVIKQTKKSSTGRVIHLNSANARIENITLTGGQIGDNYENGGGVLIGVNGGTLSHCIISNNYLSGYNHFGGGISMQSGRLEFCSVVENYAGANYGGGNDCRGGGVAFADTITSKDRMPVVDSCLIANNKCGQRGGGLAVKYGSYGAILNSTVAGNTASLAGNAGGGVHTGSEYFWMTNCLVAGNTAATDTGAGKPDWANDTTSSFTSKIGYCLYGDTVSSVLGDSTCFTGNAGFKEVSSGDYHLKSLSAAIGKACAAMMPSTDLDGIARDAAPDIGCYEYDPGEAPFSCEASFSPTSLMKDKPVSLEASLVNDPQGIVPVYTWTFTREEDAFATNFVRETAQATATLDLPGKWSISLVVSDKNSSVKTDETICEGTLLTGSHTNYVTSAENEKAAFPYDTPGNAATSPDDILAYLVNGSVVILDEGTHYVSRAIDLETGVKVYGAGRDKTTVRPTKSSNVHHRLAYLNHPDALISGVTLAGCVSDGGYYYIDGMAICIGALGGTIRDSRVTQSYWHQVSCHGAIASTSVNGLIDNVIIENNTNDCFNLIGQGAGLYMESGTARNCLIRNNVASGVGRTAAYVYSCAKLENCTIVNNSDANTTNSAALFIKMGESCDGYVRNCVVADNVVGTNGDFFVGQPNWMHDNSKIVPIVSHCCWVGSATLGSNCADGTKAAFVDAPNGDYRLTIDSSCRNTGFYNASWMAGAKDLDGNPRVFGRNRVDMGCYECQKIRGLMMILK